MGGMSGAVGAWTGFVWDSIEARVRGSAASGSAGSLRAEMAAGGVSQAACFGAYELVKVTLLTALPCSHNSVYGVTTVAVAGAAGGVASSVFEQVEGWSLEALRRACPRTALRAAPGGSLMFLALEFGREAFAE